MEHKAIRPLLDMDGHF